MLISQPQEMKLLKVWVEKHSDPVDRSQLLGSVVPFLRRCTSDYSVGLCVGSVAVPTLSFSQVVHQIAHE